VSERFFILGCQRSGTTLLRLILESHPDVFCHDELTAYSILAGSAAEEPPRPVRRIGFKVPRYTEQFLDPVLRDDGIAGDCAPFYLGEPILFVVRNVYDTIASMRKLKFDGATWCELWVPRNLEAKWRQNESFREQYAEEWRRIEDSSDRLLGQAALYWKYKTEALFRYQAAGLPILPVKYERLVAQPEVILRSVCDFLSIPFDDCLLRHHEASHTELFENGWTVGNTDPGRPIQRESVGQSPQFLTNDECRQIDTITGSVPAQVAQLCLRTCDYAQR
jgi:sulfotransferase family protein